MKDRGRERRLLDRVSQLIPGISEAALLLATGLLVMGAEVDCQDDPTKNAPDAAQNETTEQHYTMFTSRGIDPYTRDVDADVDYWCEQHLGQELSPQRLYTPHTVESADPPSYEDANCTKFFLDPAIAEDNCSTGGDPQGIFYAEHMRTKYSLTDSTARVIFVVHPTEPLLGEWTLGVTYFVAEGEPAASTTQTGAFVFRDVVDSKVRFSFTGYPSSGDTYETGLIRLTSLTFIHEFGHHAFGLWHANYDLLNYAGNPAHTLDGSLGRCVMTYNLEQPDIESRWPLRFCEDVGSGWNDSCRKRIRARYGLAYNGG